MTEEADGRQWMTVAQEHAARAIDPCATSSRIVAAFREEDEAAIDQEHGQAAVRHQVEEVRNGALTMTEATLVGQAAALNALAQATGQRPEEAQAPAAIQRIERVVVYPPSEPGGPEFVRHY